MSLPQLVTLVDVDGYTIPVTERAADPEPDPTAPQNWPDWCDNFFWMISDPDELAELEAAEIDRILELVDGPQASDRAYADRDAASRLVESLIESSLPPVSGGSPEAFSPSPEDLEEYAVWSASLDGMSMPQEASREERIATYHAFVKQYLADQARIRFDSVDA
jgi:hypothetical protein